MKIDEYDLPDDLFYHEEHTYAKVEGDLVVVGVTDFAQKMAGTIKRVVTLEEDDEVQQGKPFGTLSSGKWTGKLYSPISGEIAEGNYREAAKIIKKNSLLPAVCGRVCPQE